MLSCMCLGSASERRGLWPNDFKVLTALRPFSAHAGSSLLPARPRSAALHQFNGRTSGTRTMARMGCYAK